MKNQFILLFLAITLILTSCTQQQMAKRYGGQATIKLQANERVVNVTWKESNIWILTKLDTTKPSIYQFKENSNLGIMEGTVIIQEQ